MGAEKDNKHPGGRPADYDPSFHDEEGYRLALLGKTAQEIAVHFGQSHSTIKRWFKQYPGFWASVTRGRESADAKVAEGLYKRATGFEIDSEELLVVKVSRDEEEVRREKITKYFPPDQSAAMNWLKNRQPDKWRDKQDVAVSGTIELTMNLEDAPKENGD